MNSNHETKRTQEQTDMKHSQTTAHGVSQMGSPKNPLRKSSEAGADDKEEKGRLQNNLGRAKSADMQSLMTLQLDSFETQLLLASKLAFVFFPTNKQNQLRKAF